MRASSALLGALLLLPSWDLPATELLRWRLESITHYFTSGGEGHHPPSVGSITTSVPQSPRFLAPTRRACVRRARPFVLMGTLALASDPALSVLRSRVLCLPDRLPSHVG